MSIPSSTKRRPISVFRQGTALAVPKCTPDSGVLTPEAGAALRKDDEWMLRAFALALRGVALAHPNPMVGAVLVKNGKIIGEGFHDYDRRDHAEIVALRQAGKKARGATLYVSLEPCVAL